jgi:hypothetical protein
VQIEMPLEDIPQELLEDIGHSLQHYLVPLFVLTEREPVPRLRFIGSGTLVEIQRTRYILTAAHVWSETEGAGRIGVILTATPSAFTIERNLIYDQNLRKPEYGEWGPDLALLTIPRSDASTIAAHKSFVNLGRQKAMFGTHPPATEKGCWAVTGMVGEFSRTKLIPESKRIEAVSQARAFFSVVLQTHQRDGYDYLDLGAKLELPGVPSKFGGISGGGLWEIGLKKSKSGAIAWDEKLNFRGVAFWESAPSDHRRVIRCHGPRSIFEKAWREWGLP